MASRTEAPTKTQALEDLDDVGLDVEGTEPVEETEGATPPIAPETPAAGETPVAEQEEAEPTEPPPAPPQQTQWQPPEGGQPFRFRADHREVEVPGALEWDHGIYVPKDAWNGVVSRHLADRDALTQQHQQDVQHWQRLASERDPEKNPEVIQARVTLQKFLGLMDQGPEKVAEWLDNFAVNRPLLEQQIRADTLETQLQARQKQVTEQEYEAWHQNALTQLPGYVQQNIADLIGSTPELSELKGSEQALVEQVWPYLKSFLSEDPQTHAITAQQAALASILKREAGRRKELKRLTEAAKHNERATGKAPTPKTVPSRGRPVPAGQEREYKPGESRKAKDDFLEWDALAE